MRRREFIKIIAGPALAWPLAAHAQQGERVRRIGVLMARAATDPEATEDIGAFAQGLAELGWTIGRNVRIEYRYAAGDPEMFRKYAKEMVALAPDVVLASGTPERSRAPAKFPFHPHRVCERHRSGRRRLR
jgi:putative tryptophan/tyrosine transport system substrate-binding protein